MQSHASIFLVPRFSITLCLPATQRLSALSLASPPCNILTASSLVSASSSPIKIQPVRPTLGANRYTCATTRGLQPTYTHDRPFSKREIGLTPHSPSGSLPTQKGKSRPLGTWILDKLRPLCANAHVHVSQRPRDAVAITQSYYCNVHHPDKKFLLLSSMLLHFQRLRKIHCCSQHGSMD